MIDALVLTFTSLSALIGIISLIVNIVLRSKSDNLKRVKSYLYREKWDYINDCIKYTYTLINETEMSLAKEISVIPMKGISLMSGSFWHSGRSTTVGIFSDNCEITVNNNDNNRLFYEITPNATLQKNELFKYKVSFTLKNEYFRNTKPYLSINITRPTNNVLLSIIIACEVKITNVRLVEKFRDDNTHVIEVAEKTDTMYSFSIGKPKLHSEYGIQWDWVLGTG